MEKYFIKFADSNEFLYTYSSIFFFNIFVLIIESYSKLSDHVYTQDADGLINLFILQVDTDTFENNLGIIKEHMSKKYMKSNTIIVLHIIFQTTRASHLSSL